MSLVTTEPEPMSAFSPIVTPGLITLRAPIDANLLTRVSRSFHSPWAFGNSSRHELRSEEHTSELQSRLHLVCRLLLEKKKHEQKEDEGQHEHAKDNLAGELAGHVHDQDSHQYHDHGVNGPPGLRPAAVACRLDYCVYS